MNTKIDSVKKVDYIFCALDPNFAAELAVHAEAYNDNQNKADYCSWEIAKLVNSMWSEYEKMFEPKMDYYAECSRSANAGLKKKRFADSGQTLRRWCEVQATYAEFADAERFLDALSFEHLRIAKKLAGDGRVSVPVYALAKAVEMEYTADEMQNHFDPPEAVHPFDKVMGWVSSLMAERLEWIKDKGAREEAIGYLKKYLEIVQRYK